jgi:hypothetical protein
MRQHKVHTQPGRTAVQIFAANDRMKKVPPQLNRAHCTPQQARAGLAESAARFAEMLAEALGAVTTVKSGGTEATKVPKPL